MLNASKKKILKSVSILAICGALVVGQSGISLSKNELYVSAAENIAENVVYYDDVYGTTSTFQGQGTQTSATYNIYCDEVVVVARSVLPSVPSFGNGDSSMDNVCGPVAGTNIVGYYDRWYTNLIPNYEPGMVTSSGSYRYFPDLALDATCNVIESLYGLMNVATVGGTTSANFKNGLTTYVRNQGYNLSYSSFYSNATMVDLTKLTNAVHQGKVGLVMCSQYNFVYGIDTVESEERVLVTKINSTTGHMMMVYGYQTLAFYQDGNHVGTRTFLYACSGYGGCEKGYMELNDFSVINEALIMSIT